MGPWLMLVGGMLVVCGLWLYRCGRSGCTVVDCAGNKVDLMKTGMLGLDERCSISSKRTVIAQCQKAPDGQNRLSVTIDTAHTVPYSQVYLRTGHPIRKPVLLVGDMELYLAAPDQVMPIRCESDNTEIMLRPLAVYLSMRRCQIVFGWILGIVGVGMLIFPHVGGGGP